MVSRKLIRGSSARTVPTGVAGVVVTAALALGLLTMGIAVSQAATLYKWVDADGNVTYQDTPPPGNVEFETNEVDKPAADISSDRGAQIEQAALDNPVSLYTVPACDSCDLVRLYLERNAIPFIEKDVRNDLVLRAELETVAGSVTVPTLIIGDRVVDGYNRGAMGLALSDAGFPVESGIRQANPADPDSSAEGDIEGDIGDVTESTDATESIDSNDQGLEPLDLNDPYGTATEVDS